jgi:hypothetical protein
MIRGSCLCGGVKFEIASTTGPFELCHCGRCRKASGSAFAAGLRVRGQDLRVIQGQELIKTFEAPIVEAPPPYTNRFCGRCGSPVPVPSDDAAWFDVPAGLLDDDPQLRPDKHIYTDFKSPWDDISDRLPQMTKAQIRAYRRAQG